MTQKVESKPRRLGRGLAALIGDVAPVAVEVPTVVGTDTQSAQRTTQSAHPEVVVGGATDLGRATAPVGGRADSGGDSGLSRVGGGSPTFAQGGENRGTGGGGSTGSQSRTSGTAPFGLADSAISPDEGGVVMIAVGEIQPNPFQPRRGFAEEALRGLADSIRASGVMQPVIVRVKERQTAPSGLSAGGGSATSPVQSDGGGARYELVAGERRWRAATLAGLARIPALVRKVSDQESAQLAIVENVQREDLNPIEKAYAFKALIERWGMTHGGIANRVGVDRVTVANLVRLTELPPQIRAYIEKGELSGSHGKALLGLSDPKAAAVLADRAARQGWSVRKLEEEVSREVAYPELGPPPPQLRGTVDGKVAARAALEKQLGEHLGTKVRISTDRSGTRGRMVIEFYGLDHFDGLLERFGWKGR